VDLTGHRSEFAAGFEVHVIRTHKVPFLQSRASGPLIAMTSVIMSIGVLVPITPLGRYLGFAPLPRLYWLLLAVTLLAYMLLTQGVKTWLIRRAWI
jgi:Mg2+-importing ATPase